MRKILAVIDMQNDFIDGTLGSSEAQAIVERVKNKIKSYPAENIVVTMDTHSDDYMATQEGKNLPVPHCIKGQPGWLIHKELSELLADARVFEKPSFGSLELAVTLSTMAADEELEIELIGLCTDICVVSNALLLKAFLPETPILVDASCCAGVTLQKHLAALETMRSCQIRIIND